MNKDDFIQKIILRHSPNMNPEQMTAIQEDYTAILEDNTDFDLLFQTYLEEYQNKTYPPPAWFKQRAKKRHNPVSSQPEIRSIYIKLPNGLKYEFGYIYPEETEYMAKIAIMDKFKSRINQAKESGREYKIEFLTREEFKRLLIGEGIC